MSHLDHKMEKGRRRTTRTVILFASATAALCFGGPLSSVASAQSSSAPASGARVLDSQRPDLGPAPVPAGPMPAPVGHRQPRQKDLPPSVLRDEGGDAPRNEGATTTGQGSSDRSLTICRKC
jgi:hypothetical protein